MKTLKKSTELTDEDLVKAIVITGNTLFFELLYDRYADLVFYKCCCFSKNEDEAKHLAQDVFLNLFVTLTNFKGTSKFSIWLCAFTYNYCVNHITKNTTKEIEKQSIDCMDFENISNIEDEFGLLEINVEELQNALELISPEDKMILLLKYQDLLSNTDIEIVLEKDEITIDKRIKSAKRKLISVYNKTKINV